MVNEKKSLWRCTVVSLLVFAIAAPCSTAAAAATDHAPIVLNGHLATADFDGGVGYRAAADGGGAYATTLVYPAASHNTLAHTVAFIAAVRGRALHGTSMHGYGFGHR
ncbi:MAG: hypothetical protein ACXWLW_05505 [Rhizomicrobium sp.]